MKCCTQSIGKILKNSLENIRRKEFLFQIPVSVNQKRTIAYGVYHPTSFNINTLKTNLAFMCASKGQGDANNNKYPL